MRKLSIICLAILFVGLMSGSAFAIGYCKDLLEPENPGGWGTSLKTFDDEWNVCHGIVLELDIWINDVPEPLFTAGFSLTASNVDVNFIDVEVYDDNDLPGPWHPDFSNVITDNDEGFVYATVGNLQSPASPDGDGDIIIAKVRFEVPCMTQTYLTISTVPGFDTVVGESSTVYQITPNTIMVWEASWPCCCTYILTDDPTTISPGGTIDFDVNSTGFFCNLPIDLVFSDDCLQGDVDPITGVFTADTTLALENCEVCVVDNSNTGSCDDFLCNPDEDCCADVTILECTEEGDGDGICDEDDNCPNHPNGPRAGICIQGDHGLTCTIPGYNSSECGFGGYCSMAQEDNYPPLDNNCGDACECEGNFDDDDNQDGSDAAIFKTDFGRDSYNNPCSSSNRCNGNFDCDENVDGSDAAKFEEDFGRDSYNNPCPICPTEPWCVTYQ